MLTRLRIRCSFSHYESSLCAALPCYTAGSLMVSDLRFVTTPAVAAASSPRTPRLFSAHSV